MTLGKERRTHHPQVCKLATEDESAREYVPQFLANASRGETVPDNTEKETAEQRAARVRQQIYA